MELHEHFLKIAELESPIFKIIDHSSILQESITSIVSKSIQDFWNCLKTACTSRKQLQFLRFFLCQIYKLEYENEEKEETIFDINSSQVLEFLVSNELDIEKENQNILFDIIILQIVLFEKQRYFIPLFKKFQTSITLIQLKTTNKSLKYSYLRLLKCFLSAWEIFNLLHDRKKLKVDPSKSHLEECKDLLLSTIISDLQTWIECEQSDEWFVLNSILLKIVGIAKDTKILNAYLNEILKKRNALRTFCIISDYVFPLNSSDIDISHSLVYSEKLWSLIQNNLISTDFQHRKQALYLFKKLMDFIDVNQEKLKYSVTLIEKVINPFICSELKDFKNSIEQIRTNFVLIMEALEEKQKHLIIPSLSLVNSIIEGHIEHKSCGNCVDFSWIYCIFAKLLKHDNNSILKWGLIKSLSLNIEAYNNDEFILLIVQSLNNTFLYETFSGESQPEIVTMLTNWYNTFQSKDLHLIEKSINLFCNVSWGPTAIFYVLQSLLSTSDKLDNIVNCQQEQLDSISLLFKRNIKLYFPMMRSMSQIMLFKILSRFSQIHNLTVISNLLSTFNKEDLKEKYCWVALISWLDKIQYNDAINFITHLCESLTIDDENVKISMYTFSIILQLLYEGKVICQEEQCIATQKLKTLLLCLDKIDVRPYVKVSFIIKILDLIYNLFDLKQQIPEFIYNLFISYKETIFNFILKLFHNDNFNYDHYKICIRVLQTTNSCTESKINMTSIVTSNNLKYIETKCIQVLSNINKHNEIQLLFALQLWSNISYYYKYEDKFFFQMINNLINMHLSKKHKTKLTGKIGVEYYTALSKLVKNHVLTMRVNDLKRNDNWLQILSSTLDIAGNQVLIYFGDIINAYASAFVNNVEKLEELKVLIKSFWRYNFNSKREKIFWIVAQNLTKCIISLNFLNVQSLQETCEEFTEKMMSEGDALPGLKYILLTCGEIHQHFNLFMKAILNGLLHGQILRRDQRIAMQACIKGQQIISSYKLKHGKIENFDIYYFINRKYNIDATIRAAAVIQLCKAICANKENATLFLPLVLEKLSSIKNKRYYAESHLHRLKHRLMQVLLLLQPHLDKISSQFLLHKLCDSLLKDSDQYSVRLMREWLLIRIYLSDTDYLADLWSFFDKICNERPGSAGYFIGIIWHIAQKLEKKDYDKFASTALSKIGVCCMGQQFNMRLFSQVFFIKLYDLLDEDSETKKEYIYFYKSTLSSLNCDHFRKNPILLKEDFFYKTFDPIKHYCLETIYHFIPLLSNINVDEWITKKNFEEQIFLTNSTINIKIVNSDDNYLSQTLSDSIGKCSENSETEEMNHSEVNTDIQRKTTPWKTMLLSEEALFQDLNLPNLKSNVITKQDIIVVASFVEKPQNLGGIARTCEIFAVKELVVSNLKQVEDKEFKALSVSADKWIKLTEVKLFELVKYLFELKNNGWTLIGAEQTANSVNLFDFKFTKQTVLILGNEKYGIPPNIIPLLDICVEIPQFGVIRSLNVHVTSAICIWEYIKQHQNIS